MYMYDSKRLISFELTFAVLQGYLNFNGVKVKTNVVYITLCESLLSIDRTVDKSAFLYWSRSYKALDRQIFYVMYVMVQFFGGVKFL